MSKEIVNPPQLAPPRGFNHAIAVDGGRLVFLAGQDATGPDGDIVAPGDLVAQFERVMENLSAVVEAAGGASSDIVKLNIFVADREDYLANLGPLGEIFGSYFDAYPALALFEVAGFFHDEAVVELEGFAVVDGEAEATSD